MTDHEIDLLVKCLTMPPPYGFTAYERKEFIEWLKQPYTFVQAAEKRKKINSGENRLFKMVS